MPPVDFAGWTALPVVSDIAVAAFAVGIAVLLHALFFSVARRLAERTVDSADDAFVARARRPTFWILIAVALAMVRRYLNLPAGIDALWTQVAGLVVPALVGWLVIALIRASARAVELTAKIDVEDNLVARQRRTRAALLARIAMLVVGFVTICLMLLSIPSVRNIGVTLMASAGLAGLAVGAAAQPALKNIIAGIQMAFTEPIRIDDVVIIEGEWGKIEEIRLTYVVVAIWDERRLIVPISKFLEEPFQNWTRRTSKLLGSAFFYLDPTADIARLRAKYEEVVTANPRFDGRAFVLQVTDSKPDSIEVRVLATAKDAPTAFDLRCDLREAMLAFIRDEMPEALPRGAGNGRGGGLERATERGVGHDLAKRAMLRFAAERSIEKPRH